MAIEHPHALLGRLKLGREEYCQRLLTQLILDDAYPPWNTESTPSSDGIRFLEMLEELSFGVADCWDEPVYVDELDLPRRHDAEKGCAPDLALRDGNRLWLVELKTEAGSHRADQLPAYFELARHHYPDHRIDLTYLTGPLEKPAPAPPPGCRYAHVTWSQVLPFVDTVWGERRGVQGKTADTLREVLEDLGSPWSGWRAGRLGTASSATSPADPVEEAMALALATARDHRQRALDFDADSLERLQQLRQDVREAIHTDGTQEAQHVRPWLWQSTSGGDPLTTSGSATGYELRLSWYGSVPDAPANS